MGGRVIRLGEASKMALGNLQIISIPTVNIWYTDYFQDSVLPFLSLDNFKIPSGSPAGPPSQSCSASLHLGIRSIHRHFGVKENIYSVSRVNSTMMPAGINTLSKIKACNGRCCSLGT